MEDVYERQKRAKLGDKCDVGQVEYYEHVWHLLKCPALLSWVNSTANGGHGKWFPLFFFLFFSVFES
jgi:hypothetical protein